MDRSTALLVLRLQEAHALERGLVRTLQSHIAMTPRGDLRDGLERHLEETRGHAERTRDRVAELGADDNILQSAIGAIGSVIGQALALSRAPLDLVRGPGGELKILENTRDEIAAEAFEVATYEAIEGLATELGDTTTAALAASIRDDEERQLEALRGLLPGLARDVVAAEVRGEQVHRASRTGAADALRQGVRRVRGTADEAAATVRATADGAAASAREAADATRGAAEGATRAVQDAAEEAAEAALARAGEARKGAKATAGQARGGAKATAGQARGGAKATAGRAREQAKATAGQARQGAKTTAARARSGARTAGAGEPWVGYDEQPVREILTALRAGDAALAGAVADHERATKARKTILDDAEKRR